jgi:hypothetical protein
MDRPRTPVGWILRILAIALCLGILYVLIASAIMLIGGFISPESGNGPGNIGHLVGAIFMLVLAGPFIALILALGLPIVSDNPKFRGADR